MWQETVFGDNLIYDLSTADTVDALLRCALSHSNILYSAERVDMYLTEGCSTGDLTDCGNVSLRASFTENGVQVGDLGSSFSRFDAARFISSSGESSAVYLSPLHMGSCFFGYIALSFSEPTRVYDMNYLCLVSGLNISLGRLLCTDDRSRSNRSAAARKKKVPHSDELTELRRKLSAVPEEFPNIDAICAAVNMSRSSLQKNYRACFGVSIFDELIRFRIEKARRLLSDTSFSITEISVMCGYSSDSYFMKQFKKLTGLTPSEYRARE
jgi:AraC-like DNA-binding protein